MADELDFWMQQLVIAAQAVGRVNFSTCDMRSLDDARKNLRAYVESRATPEPSEAAVEAVARVLAKINPRALGHWPLCVTDAKAAIAALRAANKGE
jgi:hypothetical protein